MPGTTVPVPATNPSPGAPPKSKWATLNGDPTDTTPVNYRIPKECNALCTFKSNHKTPEKYFITAIPDVLKGRVPEDLFRERMVLLNTEWQTEELQESMVKLRRSGWVVNSIGFALVIAVAPAAKFTGSAFWFLMGLVGVFVLLVVNIGAEYVETTKEIAEDWTDEDAQAGRNLIYVVRVWRVGPLQSLLNVHVTVLEQKEYLPEFAADDVEAQPLPTYASEPGSVSK
ncbi:hypothetical protein BC830DRAFT_1174145 [Chytriomyces sp. MP71]|nr:hypothetical protein BC830DRAFT_1174145 [Chytriomyces sp. MP71]